MGQRRYREKVCYSKVCFSRLNQNKNPARRGSKESLVEHVFNRHVQDQSMKTSAASWVIAITSCVLHRKRMPMWQRIAARSARLATLLQVPGWRVAIWRRCGRWNLPVTSKWTRESYSADQLIMCSNLRASAQGATRKANQSSSFSFRFVSIILL